MHSLAVIGAQWGDEGKGKITDLLGAKCDIVVRYQGGNNAGHTIVAHGKKTIFHLIPSGILHDNCISVLGHGVAFDPEAFVEELRYVEKSHDKNIAPQRLKVSAHCSVITAYNKILDAAREERATASIGTTVKGIGPTYEDKVARRGLKLQDLLDKDLLAQKLRGILEEKEVLFGHLYKRPHYPSLEEEVERLYSLGEQVAPFLTNTFCFLHGAASRGKKILYEGAQGVLLDVDYGSYPYVTSSHTTLGGIYTGAGFPPRPLNEVLGVVKAYTTRVGLGPFPTELTDEEGEYLQDVGGEFGATTGRKRRCGWIDLPLLKYAVLASGVTALAITKLDVLSGIKILRLCYAYEYEERRLDCAYPGIDFSKVRPLFKEVTPFRDDFSGALEGQKMSPELCRYIETIERACGVKATILSYGPSRGKTSFLKEYF